MATTDAPAAAGSTIQIERRNGRSTSMLLLHKFLRPIRSQLVKFGKPVSAESQQVKITKKAKQLCNVEERNVDDIYIYDFTAKTPVSKTNAKAKRVLYYAGGGWQLPTSAQHVYLCAALATKMPNTTVSLVSYPLAPNSPAPKSFPAMCKQYRTLLMAAAEADETLIVAGDSAGGNIALCMPIHMLSEAPDLTPAAIMVLSPSTDLRRGNPMIEAVAKHDPILTVPFIKSTADKWRADWDAFDPRVSPLAADLSILVDRDVQVHGAVGTFDILSPDALIFRSKLAEAGVHGRWLEWEKQMHVWLLTGRYGLREAREGIEWMAEVLNAV